MSHDLGNAPVTRNDSWRTVAVKAVGLRAARTLSSVVHTHSIGLGLDSLAGPGSFFHRVERRLFSKADFPPAEIKNVRAYEYRRETQRSGWFGKPDTFGWEIYPNMFERRKLLSILNGELHKRVYGISPRYSPIFLIAC